MKPIFSYFLLLLSCIASAEELSFRQKYALAAKDLVPIMQIKSCNTKVVKNTNGKSIIECGLVLDNSLLTLDVINNKLTGVWLMYDASKLEHPADLIRVGGMLLRALRGTSPAGDHIAVADNIFNKSYKNNWKETCIDDTESESKFCVQSDDKNIFHITLEPMKLK